MLKRFETMLMQDRGRVAGIRDVCVSPEDSDAEIKFQAYRTRLGVCQTTGKVYVHYSPIIDDQRYTQVKPGGFPDWAKALPDRVPINCVVSDEPGENVKFLKGDKEIADEIAANLKNDGGVPL